MASYVLAFQQKTPTAAPKLVGLFFLFRNQVYVETKKNILPVNQVLVNEHNDILRPTSDLFLRQLAKSATLSMITYYYTENDDLAQEYKNLLQGGASNKYGT